MTDKDPAKSPNANNTQEQSFDPLASIWQQQEVLELDTQEVMSRWRAMRAKQMAYLAGDVLGLLFALGASFYILVLKPESFWLIKLWVVLMTAMGVYMTYVFVRQRRHVLSGGATSTEDYYQRLLNQCDNNIAIARQGWKMCLWVFGLMQLFLLSYWGFGDISRADILIKVLETNVFLLLFGAMYKWWSSGHISRNQREKSRLQALDSQTDMA